MALLVTCVHVHVCAREWGCVWQRLCRLHARMMHVIVRCVQEQLASACPMPIVRGMGL